jgi:hypothetical protein
LSGVKVLDPCLPEAAPILGLPHPFVFEPESFVYQYLHIQKGDLSDTRGTFEGAEGVGEFSDVEIDPSKLSADFPYFGKPHMVQVATEMGPFTRAICNFRGADEFAEGLPCAVRYYGDTYDIAFIGFPLWSLKLEDARVFASQLLQNMGY